MFVDDSVLAPIGYIIPYLHRLRLLFWQLRAAAHLAAILGMQLAIQAVIHVGHAQSQKPEFAAKVMVEESDYKTSKDSDNDWVSQLLSV